MSAPKPVKMSGLTPSTLPLAVSAQRAAMKAAAFYAVAAYTPLPQLMGFSSLGNVAMAALIFAGVDMVRRGVIDPQMPEGWSDWTRDQLGPGGDYTDFDNLWQNAEMAVMCRTCVVQTLLFWGVLTLTGNYAGTAVGLAATSFVSSVLYHFVNGFVSNKHSK